MTNTAGPALSGSRGASASVTNAAGPALSTSSGVLAPVTDTASPALSGARGVLAPVTNTAGPDLGFSRGAGFGDQHRRPGAVDLQWSACSGDGHGDLGLSGALGC